MKPVRIVHFTSSLKIGGAEAILYTIVSSLTTQNFEHHVVYIHDGPYKVRFAALGIPVHQVSGYFFRYDGMFLIRLFLLFKKLQPSCIHTLLWAANCSGRLVAWLLGIPCISVYHNNVNQDGFVRSCLDQLTIRLANQIVAVSDEVKTSVITRTLKPASLDVIRNGIDYRALQQRSMLQAKTRASLLLANNALVIGSVGRFHPVKNLELLITSFAAVHATLAHTRLVLVGQGELEGKLRALVTTLNLDSYVTFVVGQEASGYYHLFDCFVMSSCQEGISMALLEAMSLGRACVITNITQNHHSVITPAYDGIAVPANNSQALANALLQVCTDELLRKKLGMHARQTIEKSFGFSGMIQQYERLFMQANAF